MRRSLLLLAGLVTACDNAGSAAPQTKPSEQTRKLAGIFPDDWKCEDLVTTDALAGVLEGTVRQIDTPMSPPRGVPHPCNYEVSGPSYEFWTFDIDCRDGMKQRADALFEQYKAGSSELVQQYNALADGGSLKATDAGYTMHAPEAAAEVAVGAKALDHHGQALIFIDDDAPCYVRVIGPDAAHRLALAKLLAKRLTFANAPMMPRPMP